MEEPVEDSVLPALEWPESGEAELWGLGQPCECPPPELDDVMAASIFKLMPESEKRSLREVEDLALTEVGSLVGGGVAGAPPLERGERVGRGL